MCDDRYSGIEFFCFILFSVVFLHLNWISSILKVGVFYWFINVLVYDKSDVILLGTVIFSSREAYKVIIDLHSFCTGPFYFAEYSSLFYLIYCRKLSFSAFSGLRTICVPIVSQFIIIPSRGFYAPLLHLRTGTRSPC